MAKGAAYTWMIVIFSIFVTGLIYMMLWPLIETFIALGTNSSADPWVMTIIGDTITYWLPISIIISLVVYGWRKSRSRYVE